MRSRRFRHLAAVAAVTLLATTALGAGSCSPFGLGSPWLFFRAPLLSQLSLPEGVAVELRVSRLVDPASLEIQLDGVTLDTTEFHPVSPEVIGTTLDPLAEGAHTLTARAELKLLFLRFPLLAATRFDIAALQRPDECEILNQAHCLLPYPSSRFLEPVSDTETGYRTSFPEFSVPGLIGPPLDPAPSNVYDGFAPTVQILAHLPGASPERSNASRLLPPVAPLTTPYVNVRTHDASSLARRSPTVLLDADTGERVLHWIEADANTSDPARQVLFLRPAHALVPGHRYIVAFRRMLDASGQPVPVEAVFRALRDGAPSTIPALEARREHFEDLFRELWHAGVARHDLQLAFDFVVRSEKQLHERMLFMRDDALAWLASHAPDDLSGFANLTVRDLGDCSAPSQRIWRHVTGTFAGPYYLNGNIDDPTQLVLMNVDANRMPVRSGTFPFNFDVAVPCDVYRGEAVGHPLMLGHGFLGRGADMVSSFVAGSFFTDAEDVSYIAGATDWRGLSLGLLDAGSIAFNIIGNPVTGHRFNNFAALPNRLKQGMVNTLVLSRMLKSGYLNRLAAFQRTPGDPATGVFTPDAEAFYFGVSLGGIYGTMYAALNQDVVRHNVDVPAMNFSVLQQRSTQFPQFFSLIRSVGMTDPLEYAVVQQLQHEQWVSAEPAAYVRNVTGAVDAPLPNTPPKQLLVTVAWLDKQVSNQAQEIFARSLGIPSLAGSLQASLPGIPDEDAGSSGLASAYVVYDTGYFDLLNPAHQPLLPPLANLIPSPKCDPHGTARLSIPASVAQLAEFLRPGGRVFNFCDGVCDAQAPEELPAQSCDPLL